MDKLKDIYKIDQHIIHEENYEFTENLYNGTERRIIEIFNCLICLKIVNNPAKCGQCSKFFCGSFIEDAILNKNRCPNCLCSPFNKDKIDILFKNLLNDSIFTCPMNCGKVIR